jgi:hypothetical protein
MGKSTKPGDGEVGVDTWQDFGYICNLVSAE